MSDWRQIQARIRKAKTSTDPLTKLSELYQRTRDAMVAWELGVVEEKGGRPDQAAKWYAAAAQHFRRAEWKKKAEEALARLGVEAPASSETPSESVHDISGESFAESGEGNYMRQHTPLSVTETPRMASPARSLDEETVEAVTPGDEPDSAGDASRAPAMNSQSQSGAKHLEGHRKRRRGRRGGRGRHHKSSPATAPSLPSQTFTPPSSEPSAFSGFEPSPKTPTAEPGSYGAQPTAGGQAEGMRTERRRFERTELPIGSRTDYAESALQPERTARGRAGDPALASRMARLESMLRRLLSSSPHHLDEIDDAPAGPGVFLLSDSDQITSYYVEACQTLRIGVGNLVRGGRAGKGRRPAGRGYSEGGDLREKLAEHLGINQSKVSQYMKEHCVIRWIQLDDDAPHLAHFAVAVLRTPLNLE